MENNENNVLFGTVRWFNRNRGFGFILPDIDTAEQDLFVHYSEIIEPRRGKFKSLDEGMRVSYILGANEKGIMATSVRRLLPEGGASDV